MSQFLYFVPGVTKGELSPAELDAIGLGHVHDGCQPQCTQNVRGPDNAVGMLLAVGDTAAPGDAPADLRYVPVEQIWRAGVRKDGKPQYFVGHWKTAKPTEASLRRRVILGGHDVTLRDGSAWRVPVAASDFANATLPLIMDYDDDKQAWLGRPGPEFEAIGRHARWAYDKLETLYFGNDDDRAKSISFDDSLAAVVAALAVCYRVGPVEVAAIGIVGSAEIWRVLGALCDWPALMAMLAAKKNAPAPSV